MKRNLFQGVLLCLSLCVCGFIVWEDSFEQSSSAPGGLTRDKVNELKHNAASIVASSKPVPPAKASTEKKALSEYVPDQVLLIFERGVTPEQIQNTIELVPHDSFAKISQSADIYQLNLIEGSSVAAAQAVLTTSKFVRSVEPNMIYHTQISPDDPQYSQLWGLHNIGQSDGVSDIDIDADEAWDRSTGEREFVVAVIDTGVDYTHEDLVNNMWVNPNEIAGNGIDDDDNGYIDDIYGIDTVNNDSDPMDDHYHGTHVAGTMGAEGNNAIGVVGVNWRTSIIACKFLSSGGSGNTADAIECLDYLYNLKVNQDVNLVLTNNSWGGGGYSAALEEAISRHRDAGMIFVAAAGNDSADNDSYLSYPASYTVDNIVSVAAIDRFGDLAYFSNFGATTVDVGAPGVDILSTMPNHDYGTLSGTSMASPHVAGMLSLMAADNPSLSYLELINKLYEDGAELTSLVGKSVTGKQAKLDLTGLDSDEDGMPDWWEEQYGLAINDPVDAHLDLDEDGLTNLEEYIHHTSPALPDSDSDGLNDSEEVNLYLTNPNSIDSDQDGLSDGDEVNVYGTEPLARDTDSDGINDGQEVTSYGTDPTNADSDADGLGDGFEIQYGFNPLSDSGEQHEDADDDGLSNLNEFLAGSNPLMTDTDSDGLSDAEEVNVYLTNPTVSDSDGDDLSDRDEVIEHATDPNDSDTDSDQIPDGYEVSFNLNPLINDADADPDFDHRSNYQEYLDGTHPFTPEVVDTEPNDTVDAAQSVDGFFSLNYSADIGDEYSNTSETIPHVTILGTGDGSYDYYKFTVTSVPSLAIFDIDYGYENNSQAAMDSDLTLFQEDGTQILYSDDAPINFGGQGSESGLDSFFSYTFNTAGVYIIRVSTFSRYPVLAGKGYTLQLSLESALIDADGDGMSDYWEQHFGLNPDDPADAANDNDSDGLTNLEEFQADTNPLEADSDADGLTDYDELTTYHSNPISDDTDGDGLSDSDELNIYLTDLLNEDSDEDGLSDGDEVNTYLTDPLASDSDLDGLTDGAEVEYGFSPSVYESHDTLDSDNDTLTNLHEAELGTNPVSRDSDQDGLDDNIEVAEQSNPLSADSDNDGIPDGYEYQHGLDLRADDSQADLDGDGLNNIFEYQLNTPVNFSNINRAEIKSSFESARNVDAGFTQRYSPNVGNRTENTSESIPYVNIVSFGNEAFDYYSFTLSEPNQTVVVDVDHATFDTIVRLYDSDRQQIEMNDDASTDHGAAGSDSVLDSYLEYSLTTPGTYYIRVERYSHNYIDSHAFYQLHISLPDAIVTDTDQDGIPDEYEIAHGLDYTYAADSLIDEDGDGLNHYWEYLRGTDPWLIDTDADGFIDSEDDAPLDSSVGGGSAPVFTELPVLEIEATGAYTQVYLPLPEVSDSDPNVSITSDVSGMYALGEYTATWYATDFVGNTSSATQTFRVMDTTPPQIDPVNQYRYDTVHSAIEISDKWAGYAYDAVDGVTEVRFESDALLRTGTHTVDVIAEDSSGNVARRTVEVSIYPSIQMGSKMHAEAGAQVDMMFALSGLPPVYPVEFDYRISYPDGSSEYYYDSIHEGQTSTQRIAIPPTSLPGEQIEVELLWVYNTHINYSSSKMKIEVIDDNRPPRLQLSAFQNGGAVTAIDKSAGNVILEVKWSDINVNDEIQIVNGSANTEIYEISSTSHSVIFELNPLELDTFLEAEFSIAERNTAEKYGATSSIELMVRDSLPTLGHGDSDNDGISDFEEGVFDDDRDGIPNYLDSNNVPNRLPMASGERDIVTESGLTFSLGNVVIRNFGSNAANATIGIESLSSDAVSSIPNYTATDENAALQPINFKVSGLVNNGDAVNIVIPLNKPIAAGMGVRKFSRADGWYNFVEDEHNALYSSNLDSDGNCPSIGSTMYASGLQEGAECLLLLIEDGGPNDTDGVQNGEVEDPVYVAAIASSSPTAKLDGPATVKEGQSFHLDANGSSDPDGDMLSFRWEQLEGPQLALENPTASRLRLIAPDVTEDSTMQFRVTVSDGHSSHTAMLRVTVTNHADDSDETGGTQDPVTPPAVSNQNPTKPPASASGGGGTFDYIWYLLMFITMCIRNVRNNDIRLTRVEN